jgi:hypothetical protein
MMCWCVVVHLFWLFKQEEPFRTCSNIFFIIKVKQYQVCVHDICKKKKKIESLLNFMKHTWDEITVTCKQESYTLILLPHTTAVINNLVCLLFFFLCVCPFLSLFLSLSLCLVLLLSHKFIMCCVVILWYVHPLVKSEMECCESGRKGTVNRFSSANT